jgi:acyl transferase domain-containing protein/acyl carrier protein
MTGSASKIAITGMSGRFPGAPDVSAFWELLRTGSDGITDLEPTATGDPRYVPAAPILQGVDLFDAGFFQLNTEQAELTDPQHRLFFECAWEAIEDAGVVPDTFDGPIGVFAGSAISSYLLFNLLPGLQAGASPKTFLAMVGNEKDYLASHLAYLLGLQGPSVGVQTACSSSLVAVHSACQSLLSGECDMALAGGVSVRVPHRVGYTYEEGSILSPTGRCRSFDEAADGTVFGSGVGVVVLRRHEDAVRDGDPIHAIILGSAVNNDGDRKAGFTAPSVDGQAAVIAEAIAMAGVSPETIGYIEAHGTATPIGDPIEIRALTQAFDGVSAGRVALGTAKAAIGHLEAAAGIAGLIAAVLAVREAVVPPVAHFRKPNPLLKLDQTPFAPNAEARNWSGTGPRRAGVSSFGIGGTNAHVVLESYDVPEDAGGSGSPVVYSVSARTSDALAASVERHLLALPGMELCAAARTSVLGRRAFGYRTTVVGRSASEIAEGLRSAFTPNPVVEQPRLGLMFTGQGAWRSGLGRELAATSPVIAEVLKRACDIAPEVRDGLFSDDADLADTAIAQPSLFALQWALVRQLGAWGVVADAQLGHSVGEIAAAASAGLIDWEDGLRFAAARGRLMAALPDGGAMAAVRAAPDSDALNQAIAEADDALSIAAINGAKSVVISGDDDALARCLDALGAQGIATQRLSVSHAFHSARMESVLAEIDRIKPSTRAGTSVLISTLSGGVLAELAVDHWSRHARQPVRFMDAVGGLVEYGCTAVLEIGPGTVLRDLARATVPEEVAVLATLTHADAECDVLRAVAGLHDHGLEVEWTSILSSGPRTRLPSYPFQRQSYWREAPKLSHVAAAGGGLLGAEIATPLADRMYANTIRPADIPWLRDHRVGGRIVVPGAAFAIMAQRARDGDLGVTMIHAMLDVPADGVQVQTIVAPDGMLAIHARDIGAGNTWRRHVESAPTAGSAPTAPFDLKDVRSRCSVGIDPQTIYARMAEDGIALGAHFQVLREVWVGDREAVARLSVTGDADKTAVLTLDGAFQALGAMLHETDLPAHVPTGFDRLSFEGAVESAAELWCHARLREIRGVRDGVVGDLVVAGADGTIVLRVEGLICKPPADDRSVATHLYRPIWVQAPSPVFPKPSQCAANLSHGADLSGYVDYGHAADRVCAVLVAEAFGKLGAVFAPGELVELSGVAPQFTRLMPRLWSILQVDGVVDGAHRALREPERDAEAALSDLRARFPDQAAETAMLARTGLSLADSLAGRVDPVAVLFEKPSDTANDAADNLYAESAYATALNTLVHDAIGRCIGDRTDLKVLEIGGGTGGTTRHVLDGFGRRISRYLFTDLSPAFLRAAERTFSSHPCLRTAVFDAERSPAEQDIPDESDLVLAANVLHATADLRSAVGHARDALRPGGWLVLVEGLRPSRWLDLTFGLTDGWWRGRDRSLRPDYPLIDAARWREMLEDLGFDGVIALTPGEGSLADQGVILARRTPEAAAATVCRVAVESGDQPPVARVLAELQALPETARRILVLTRGAHRLRPWELADPDQAAVLGLVKAVGLERPDLDLRLIDLDPVTPDVDTVIAEEQLIEAGEMKVGEMKAGEIEVAWRDGVRYARRIDRLEDTVVLPDSFKIIQPEPGRLDRLRVDPAPRIPPPPGHLEIRVQAAGLNFKDVLIAMGLVADSAGLGGECAGLVSAVGDKVQGLAVGDRVMAIAGGSMASHVMVPAERVFPIPDALSVEQAAAIPVAGFTAWHAMRELAADLRPGAKVLIHSATGGVGHFAISLARKAGADVFATAGNETKRAMLRAAGIPHVYDSRDTGFAEHIRAATGGAGIDLVLNSLTGEAIPAGLSLVKAGGRFVELGRTGIWPTERVAAAYPEVRYDIVALDRITDGEGGRLLRSAAEAAAAGRMDLPPITAVPMARTAEAFALMQRAGHIGKIVLRNPEPFVFKGDRSYLITGGLGGLGLRVAEWAAKAGAAHLMLVSRGAPDAAALLRIEEMRAAGATVQVMSADVSLKAEVKRVLGQIGASGYPLSGVFHTAGVLDDGLLATLTPARLQRVMGAKIDAGRHLDQACGDLDAFVVFSSAAGLLGSPGQANHAAANTALDALVERRAARGLPGLSIAWGPWAGVGAADRLGVGDRLAATGMEAFTPDEGIRALELAIQAGARGAYPVLAALPINWAGLRAHFGGELPPIFRTLNMPEPALVAPVQPPAVPNPDTTDLHTSFLPLTPARRIERMADLVEREAGGLLAVGGTVRRDRPLNEIGLDSLMAVELRTRLGALVGETLPATLLFNYPTVETLAAYLVDLVMPSSPRPDAQGSTASDAPLDAEEDDVLSLSSDELDAILREMEDRHGGS